MARPGLTDPLAHGACVALLALGLIPARPSRGAEGQGETEKARERGTPSVLVVVGAPGEAAFGAEFERSSRAWSGVAAEAGAKTTIIGLEPAGSTNDRDLLRRALDSEPRDGLSELWLVIIGHGTFDGKDAKLNLRGPDVAHHELAAWLRPFQRPLAVLDTTAASAPFLAALAAPGRVVLTATRSGHEQTYARFGNYLSAAWQDPSADLDKDGQTSLLEAFLIASKRVEEFYQSEGRLATEHALLDDNGDGLGTPATFFRGIRAVKKPRDNAAIDGLRAHQFHLAYNGAEMLMSAAARTRRDTLERSIAQLRERKSALAEDAYFTQLEPLLLELARLYEEASAPR
jgi:hypothetical protein